MITGYFAPLEREKALLEQLSNVIGEYGQLYLTSGCEQPVHWVQNIWYDIKEIPFTSIGDAAKKLRKLNGLWSFYPLNHARRGALITEKLPYFAPKPINFPSVLPPKRLGAFMLVDENTLLAAANTSSPYPQGRVHFNLTDEPPSRAYLKLWEALTLAQKCPQAGELCLDVGASPGGWSWVLAKLGAEVIAVDRAPLAPSVANLANVTTLEQDVFSLQPSKWPELKWVFSDVICYPKDLLDWIQRWLKERPDLKFICTLKFQGPADYAVIKEFEAIEGSFVMHLYHNKHELTWVKI